jgi:hypothetical protein
MIIKKNTRKKKDAIISNICYNLLINYITVNFFFFFKKWVFFLINIFLN